MSRRGSQRPLIPTDQPGQFSLQEPIIVENSGWDIATLVFGVLTFILAIIIMAFVIVDWQSDRQNSNNSNCSDKNPCTMDISSNDGSCSNPNVQNGLKCNSSCVKTSTGTCNAGMCTGTCPGNCASNSDCPQIKTVDTFIPYNLTGECINSICVYSAVTLAFQSTSGINSTYTCSYTTAIDDVMCLGVIDNNSTSRDCMIVEASCGVTVINATLGTEYVYLECLYAFGCSSPTAYPFVFIF